MIFEKYHDFLNVFSKQKTNKFFSHKKYDHRIEFEKKNFNSNIVVSHVRTKIEIDKNLFRKIFE